MNGHNAPALDSGVLEARPPQGTAGFIYETEPKPAGGVRVGVIKGASGG